MASEYASSLDPPFSQSRPSLVAQIDVPVWLFLPPAALHSKMIGFSIFFVVLRSDRMSALPMPPIRVAPVCEITLFHLGS